MDETLELDHLAVVGFFEFDAIVQVACMEKDGKISVHPNNLSMGIRNHKGETNGK